MTKSSCKMLGAEGVKIRILSTVGAGALTLSLAACSYNSDAFFPPIGDEDSMDMVQTSASTPSNVSATNERYAEPSAPSAKAASAKLAPLPSSGLVKTVPGQKIDIIADELNQLKSTLNQHTSALGSIKSQITEDSVKYHETVGAISSKLQVGTTKGNPIMVENWNYATTLLEDVNQNVIRLGQLARDASEDEAVAAYLLNSIASTFELSGAIDEDHARLRAIEGDTQQISMNIKKMIADINENLLRQQQYIASERRNLGTLSLAIRDGRLYGKSLSDPSVRADTRNSDGVSFTHTTHISARMTPPATTSRATSASVKTRKPAHRTKAPAPASASASTRAPAPAALAASASNAPVVTTDSRRPLMVVKFERENVNYEPALYQAAKKTLEKKPDARFEIMAAMPSLQKSPLAASAARNNATAVKNSLVNMGFPEERITMTELQVSDLETTEVRLFIFE